jgi:hypothetical protein
MQKQHTSNILASEFGSKDLTVDGRSQLLTVVEAATVLRLSKSFLDKRRLAGDGPLYLKCGRRVLYVRDDLFAWATSNKRRHTSQND